MDLLSENPQGAELEDFIAAHLASRNIFVETGVTERDPKDILELDVVWTDYSHQPECRYPVEVKSGDWGLSDIFKFYGWIKYLGLTSGLFTCTRVNNRTDEDSIKRLCDRLGVTFFHIDTLENISDLFNELGFGHPVNECLPDMWRHSFLVQRRLLRSISLAVKQGLCPKSGSAAKDYFKLINDAIFFEPDVRSRVNALLDSHFKHPRLAKSAAAEIAGVKADFENPPDTKQFRSALYDGVYYPVQACMYLSHRAKLAITKSCVDYIVADEMGILPNKKIQIFNRVLDPDRVLHDAFKSITAKLRESENYQVYPIFWQAFLWRWGGFVLMDRIDDEYEAMSGETGLPVDEIDGAINLWNELFPGADWFVTPNKDCRKMLKLMPACIRGLGANTRLTQYNATDYTELGLPDDTANRMTTDHNSTTRLLEAGEEILTQ